MSTITQKESEAYVSKGGMCCPKCQSPNIDSDSRPDVVGDAVYHDCRCVACGATWTDAYKLAAAEDLDD